MLFHIFERRIKFCHLLLPSQKKYILDGAQALICRQREKTEGLKKRKIDNVKTMWVLWKTLYAKNITKEKCFVLKRQIRLKSE